VSQVIWELALLPTVEVEEAGIVEKRFVGGDINGNTEGKVMTKQKHWTE